MYSEMSYFNPTPILVGLELEFDYFERLSPHGATKKKRELGLLR